MSLSVRHHDAGKPLMGRADGVRLADPLVEHQGFPVAGLGGVVVGTTTEDVAEASDAVGLAEEVVDLLVEPLGLLVAGLGGVAVGAGTGDVTEALDAVGLARDVAGLLVEPLGLLVADLGGGEVRAVQATTPRRYSASPWRVLSPTRPEALAAASSTDVVPTPV